MKLSDSVKTLIDNFNTYVGDPSGVERSPEAALKWITVVAKDTEVMYHVTGIYYEHSTGTRKIGLKSNNPIVQDKNVTINEKPVVGVSIEYAFDDVTTEEFDNKYMLYADWTKGLLKLTVAEMNSEIFKFLHPYFITSEKDWSFEINHKGSSMDIKFWEHEGYKYEKLVIRIWEINKADITLYGDGHNESTKIFDYDDTAVTMNPVQYGPLAEEDMIKLCEKVEEIMRRNLR